MSKSKNEIIRIQVKDGFDPLVQYSSNENNQTNLKKNISNLSDPIITNEKILIEDKLLDNSLSNEISHVFDINTQMSYAQERKAMMQPSNTINAIVNKNENMIKNKFEETQIRSNDNVLIKPALNVLKSNEFDKNYIVKNCDLLRSESIIMYENANYRYEDTEKEGIIVVTEYRLIFIFLIKEEEYIYFQLLNILKIDKTNDKKNIGKYLLEITSKDNRTFKFYLHKDEQQKLYQHLLKFDNPRDTLIYYKFAIKYRESHPVNMDGWEIYDALSEYKRQGIDLEQNEDLLKIVINKNYYICETYPEILIIPNGFSEEDLLESRNFRTKNRVPVLTWINKFTGATLWRSSQTKGGITQQRCQYDEKLLKLIGELGGDRLIIFDARPYLNALANRLKGAGFENTDNYHNTEIHFLEIDNIHCVRNSLMKVHSLSRDPKIHENKKFLSILEQTLWMDFIHLLIKSSCEITSKLTKKNSVLIHCSDGWDRSTQLVTLSQVLIDPYFRTIEGFIVLIEKDWLSYGHQFGMRNGIYNKDMHEENRAPIFLQWLDCVHQLLSQFKSAFEFNNEFLLFLANHSNSYLYGTFLFNSEKERFDKNAKMKTVSVWSDVLENIDLYRNSFYSKESTSKLLFPNFSLYKLRFWEEYFLKFNLSYLNCQKKKILNDKSFTSSKSNCFFENNKKDDILTIESQKKKIETYENTLKLFYKNVNTKKVFDDLSEDSKIIFSEILNKNSLEAEIKKEELIEVKKN